MEELDITHIPLLRMDIEGNEWKVLTPEFNSLLNQYRTNQFLLEIHLAARGDNVEIALGNQAAILHHFTKYDLVFWHDRNPMCSTWVPADGLRMWDERKHAWSYLTSCHEIGLIRNFYRA